MRYTLEIQKLLLQTQNDSLHPREKANLLKEAIRIADENEDVEWATELRLDLIYELNLLSADAEEITVFSKRLLKLFKISNVSTIFSSVHFASLAPIFLILSTPTFLYAIQL